MALQHLFLAGVHPTTFWEELGSIAIATTGTFAPGDGVNADGTVGDGLPTFGADEDGFVRTLVGTISNTLLTNGVALKLAVTLTAAMFGMLVVGFVNWYWAAEVVHI